MGPPQRISEVQWLCQVFDECLFFRWVNPPLGDMCFLLSRFLLQILSHKSGVSSCIRGSKRSLEPWLPWLRKTAHTMGHWAAFRFLEKAPLGHLVLHRLDPFIHGFLLWACNPNHSDLSLSLSEELFDTFDVLGTLSHERFGDIWRTFKRMMSVLINCYIYIQYIQYNCPLDLRSINPPGWHRIGRPPLPC